MIEFNSRLLRNRSEWTPDLEPLISFPIATYNRANILFNRTIPSILNQGYSRLEIIIVGDAALPEYNIFLDDIDPRVSFYNLRSRSAYPKSPFDLWCVAGYRPRNIAARLCHGQCHWWISDDDTLEPDAISEFLQFIRTKPDVESVYANNMARGEGGKITISTLATNPAPISFPITGMPSWINRSYLSKIFRWNGLSFMNELNKPSDYDLQERMKKHGVIFDYLDKVLASTWGSEEHNWLHGSSLYIYHPDSYA